MSKKKKNVPENWDRPKYAKKLPASIRVGIYDISVDFTNLQERLGEQGRTCISVPNLAILLDNAMSEQYAKNVLLHEIMHQCLRHINMNTGADVSVTINNDDHEEFFIGAIQENLMQTLRDNPEWTEWMLRQTVRL